MARVKSLSHKKHRKILKAAKGYRQARSRRAHAAQEALLHAGAYAFHGRKLKKRDLRGLWITRLNAAVRQFGISYSKFMASIKKEKIELDKKILAEIAVKDPDTFKAVVKEAGFNFTKV